MNRPRAAQSPNAAIRRPVLSNVLWWFALVVPVLLLTQLSTGFARGMWDMGLIAGGIAAALILRGVLPMGAFLVTMTLATWNVVLFSAGDGGAPLLAVALCALGYLIGRVDGGEHPLWIQLLLAEALVLALVPLLGMTLREWTMAALFLPIFVIFPWLWGRYRHQHAELTASGWQRAHQLEREQTLATERAKLRERTRIAEDMHDSLGHELSLIAVRAAALEVDTTLSCRHREEAGQLRLSAATATERLREIIGVLREDAKPAPVTPADDSIGGLIDRASDSGMDISLRTHGGNAGLAPMADRAMYRVVQESLTNAAKHASGQPVTVEISHESGHTVVTVSNSLPRVAETSGGDEGHGLAGLGERVRLVAGGLRYGSKDGTFTVEARLPVSGADSTTEVESSESVRQMGAEQRRTKVRLVVAIAAPVGILVLLVAMSGGVWSLAQYYSYLDSHVYQEFSEGQSRGAIEPQLPQFEMPFPPTHLGGQSDFPGADCQYYRGPAGSGEIEDVYELCFHGDVLASKDVITAEERYWS